MVWINLPDGLLNQKSQTETGTYFMVIFIGSLKKIGKTNGSLWKRAGGNVGWQWLGGDTGRLRCFHALQPGCGAACTGVLASGSSVQRCRRRTLLSVLCFLSRQHSPVLHAGGPGCHIRLLSNKARTEGSSAPLVFEHLFKQQLPSLGLCLLIERIFFSHLNLGVAGSLRPYK